MKSLQRRTLLSIVASPVLAAGLFSASLLGDATHTPAAGAGSCVVAPAGGLAAAQETTTVLANALVAAVVSISDTTPPGAATAAIEAGAAAVSALLPECQQTYRLVDASGEPLGANNLPKGQFEVDALMQLVGGAPVVQEVVGGHLRTLVPLTNDMHANCATCHASYGAFAPGTVVGAASFKVKL